MLDSEVEVGEDLNFRVRNPTSSGIPVQLKCTTVPLTLPLIGLLCYSYLTLTSLTPNA